MSLKESFNRLLTEREMNQCNRLLCAALTDRKLEESLLYHKDRNLFKAYGLPDDLAQWLHSIPHKSISELAAVIWEWQNHLLSVENIAENKLTT